MEERVQSALDLFKLYHNRYPRIEMGPISFSGDLTDAGRFYLQPMRGGKPLGHETKRLGYPYVDVLKAGIDAHVTVRAFRGINPYVQFEEQYWQRIREEYIEGRRFFAHVYEPLFPRWYSVSMRQRPKFPVRYRIWPLLKRGMVINPRDQEERGYLHWSALVPEGTREHDAIQAALTLATRFETKPIGPSKEEVERLQEDLREKIALVPA